MRWLGNAWFSKSWFGNWFGGELVIEVLVDTHDGKPRDKGKRRKQDLGTRTLLLKNLADLPQAIKVLGEGVIMNPAFDDEDLLLTLVL